MHDEDNFSNNSNETMEGAKFIFSVYAKSISGVFTAGAIVVTLFQVCFPLVACGSLMKASFQRNLLPDYPTFTLLHNPRATTLGSADSVHRAYLWLLFVAEHSVPHVQRLL